MTAPRGEGHGIEVRVVPRGGPRRVALEQGRIVVRVPSPPEGGRATEDARRALADALGVPASAVRLIAGARSRRKVFEVSGVDPAEAERRVVRRGNTPR